MKKILIGLMMVALVSGLSIAGTEDSLTLTVTVGGTAYGIAITSTTQDFGTVNLAGSKSLYVGDVKNDGSTSEGIQKKMAVPGGWSIVSVTNPAANEVSLYGNITNQLAAEPTWAGGDFTTASYTGTSANSVTAGTTKGLWVKLYMPTTSALVGQQTITLSLQGVAPY